MVKGRKPSSGKLPDARRSPRLKGSCWGAMSPNWERRWNQGQPGDQTYIRFSFLEGPRPTLKKLPTTFLCLLRNTPREGGHQVSLQTSNWIHLGKGSECSVKPYWMFEVLFYDLCSCYYQCVGIENYKNNTKRLILI
ncbi:uncharacterized protein LOC107138604 isoform X2 [Marmota marmota marmota]|uniref:uncharacterized protein LOC107138604 isoform X2 n=1 Tax=Marmota marmota marmota TaxID=9994 RepID=UPI002092C4CA|nr:uncharacterized protein LOC107138604 isoform X2 [Marmota marmota marmota]